MAFDVKSALSSDIRSNSQNRKHNRVGNRRPPDLDESLEKLKQLQKRERAEFHKPDSRENAVAKTRTGVLKAREDLNSGVSDTQQAQKNATEMRAKLTEARELAAKVVDGEADEEGIAKFQKLQAEVANLAERSNSKGKRLLNGSVEKLSFKVGFGKAGSDTEEVDLKDLRAKTLGVDTDAIKIDTTDDAKSALSAIDTAIGTIGEFESDVGEKLSDFSMRHDAFTKLEQEGLPELKQNEAEPTKKREFQTKQRPGLANSESPGVFGRFDRQRADESLDQLRQALLGDSKSAFNAQAGMLGDAAMMLLAT